MKTPILSLLVMAAATSLCLAQSPGEPAANGLLPTTTTYFVNSLGNTNASGVNTNGPSMPVNNGKVESLGIGIAANGNVVVGWEDDAGTDPLLDMEAVWTLFDSSGKLITPSTVQTALQAPGETRTNKFLSYFRADGSATVGAFTWGPKIKANLFGNGFGMGSVSYGLSAEIVALAAWDDANMGDIPTVQLLNNDGTPVTVLPGVTSSYATANPGNIRIADWEYLANGNILIMGESRQNDDLVNIYGGATAQEHCIFRILTPAGAVVKAETLASEFTEKANAWHGAGVTANGFALRFSTPTGVAVRMFDNNGNPTTGDLNLATLTGHAEAGGGGRGDGAGFHGNGNDAYVAVCNYASGAWVTVLNTNGTVRYSRNVSDQPMNSLGAADAAINSTGEVIVVYGAKYDLANLGRTVLGRRFTTAGTPAGNTFFVSEVDRPAPDPLNSFADATDPRIAWRGSLVAVAWESQNDPTTVERVVARRLFTSDLAPGEPAANGLLPTTTTYFVNSLGNTNASGVNTNGPSMPVNNGKVESLGIGIAANGNVVVGWEDDAGTDPLLDMEAVWTLFDSSGKLITPSTVQTALQAPGETRTNKFLSYFRADGSATVGAFTWGPKIKANLFGNGFGMGSVSYGLSAEIVALAAWDDANMGDIPTVQLLNNDGTPVTVLPGVTSSYATANPGNIRIADWEYLANGNILIMGESRQNDDLVNIYGGATAQEHCIFRILTPAGAVVKAETLASEFTEKANAWHGAGVTANGFALRFSTPTGVAVRMFDNNGNPTTGDLNLATLTGHAEAGGGGRGDGAGFHGNGNDAYVAVCNYASGAWVTVLNTNGTVRYSRNVSDQPMNSLGAADAAINSTGEVIVVYGAKYDLANLGRTVLGRRFTTAGTPAGNTFFVSEVDRPAPDPLNSFADATDPRIAWRGSLVAVAWESQNDPTTVERVVARRLFESAPTPPSLSIARTGNNITLSWPTLVTGFTLESAPAVTGPTWSPVPGVVNNSVTVPISPGNQFYRLKQ